MNEKTAMVWMITIIILVAAISVLLITMTLTPDVYDDICNDYYNLSYGYGNSISHNNVDEKSVFVTCRNAGFTYTVLTRQPNEN